MSKKDIEAHAARYERLGMPLYGKAVRMLIGQDGHERVLTGADGRERVEVPLAPLMGGATPSPTRGRRFNLMEGEMPEESESERLCVFCGKPVEDKVNAQVQVVFDGYREHGEGQVMKKKPGKVIFWHGVCEVPDA